MQSQPTPARRGPVDPPGARAGIAIAVLALLCLLAGHGVAVARAGSASASGDRATYFWANLGQPVSSHNPFVARPSELVVFQDGQWILEKLHWSGWGSPVARAKGLSSSSNDQPNAEEGKRIITAARVTLSQPGTYRGRRVYRCIRIEVPPPASFPYSCLQRAGRSVVLGPPGPGTPVGVPGESANTGPRSFLSPDRQVWCSFATYAGEVSCGTKPEPPTHSATLHANGSVDLCSVGEVEYPPGSHVPLGCYQNWPLPSDHLPVLGYGRESSLGGFRCSSAPDGVTCIRAGGAGRGKGFRVNEDEAVQVGG